MFLRDKRCVFSPLHTPQTIFFFSFFLPAVRKPNIKRTKGIDFNFNKHLETLKAALCEAQQETDLKLFSPVCKSSRKPRLHLWYSATAGLYSERRSELPLITGVRLMFKSPTSLYSYHRVLTLSFIPANQETPLSWQDSITPPVPQTAPIEVEQKPGFLSP